MKYLGACITFLEETERDLKEELHRRLEDKTEPRFGFDIAGEMESENPPEVRAEVLSKFHEQR